MKELSEQVWFAPAVLAIVCLLGYGPYLGVAPLLDEQFLLSWTRHAGRHGVPLGQFLMWRGLDACDLWGPVATLFLKISHVLLFDVPFLLRGEGMLMHFGASWLLFAVVRRASASVPAALTCAVLFALYPLNPESVLWLGGRGSQLAGLLGIASIYAYQKGIGAHPSSVPMNVDPQHEAETADWRWLLGSLIAFTGALLSSAALWPLTLFFPLYQVFSMILNKQRLDTENPLPIIAPLSFLVVTACYIAATGLLFAITNDASPSLQGSVIWQSLRGFFLPINESIWAHYVKQYRIMYALLAPLLVAFVYVLVKNGRWRYFSIFLALWLVLAAVPALGHFDARGTMYGSHFVYAAAFPIACLFAMLCLAVKTVLAKWPRLGAGLSAVAFVALCAIFLSLLWKQDAAYDSGGRLLAKVQKSIKIVHDRTAAPYVMAREIPGRVAILPAHSTDDMVVFDGATGLLASNTLSSGRLKDALKQGKYTEQALRWDGDLNSLVALDLGNTAETSTAVSELNAQGIAQRLAPALEFYKTARLSDDAADLILQSNSMSGPAIKLAATGFTPLGPDFLYVDAKIEAPNAGTPLIELYWNTREHPDYDNKHRRVVTRAFVDGQYHRYFLPLRSTAWVTGGPADLLTLGFPAGAKVWLRSLGAAGIEHIAPSFEAVVAPGTGRHYDSPFYNFPTEPTLGLYRLPPTAQTVAVSHSCVEIPGATGAMVEISMPNRVFPNTNGNTASGVGASRLGLNGVKGTYELPGDSFPVPALYSIRAAAIDNRHNPIANFSDDIYCLITKPHKNAWSQ